MSTSRPMPSEAAEENQLLRDPRAGRRPPRPKLDYDKLQDLAEQHRALRQIMGIGDWDRQTTFDWRRIRDNVSLIRPETIQRINQRIVAEGHQLVPEAAETVRADSFVVATNIQYPRSAERR